MFRKDKKEKLSLTIINRDSIIVGDISSKNDIVRDDGVFKGNIVTDNKVIITKNGLVEGTIKANIVENKGEIKGVINTKQLTQLHLGSLTEAEIITKNLSIETGANFNGNVKMSNVKQINLDSKTVQNHKEAC